MKTAAFFDIDGTIARESLMIKHFKRLVKIGVIEQKDWLDLIKPIYDEYDRRHRNYDDYLEALAEVYLYRLKGVPQAINEFVAGQVVEEIGEKVYRYTRARLEFHHKRGDLIFFISGSPDFLVSLMAKKYSATGYMGSHYALDEKGRYTGRVHQMWDSAHKKKALEDIFSRYEIDPESSYAYGDTTGDYSMFQKMGHPVAINPTKELIRMIRNDEKMLQKIQIIVERKDMIYRLEGNFSFE